MTVNFLRFFCFTLLLLIQAILFNNITIAKCSVDSSSNSTHNVKEKNYQKKDFDVSIQRMWGEEKYQSLDSPIDLEVRDNKVFICDNQNSRVAVFNMRGQLLYEMTGWYPTTTTFDPQNRLWVAYSNETIKCYSIKGAVLKIVSVSGLINGDMDSIGFDRSGNMVIFDSGKGGSIVKIKVDNKPSQDGIYEASIVDRFGGNGTKSGSFSMEGNLFIDEKDNVFVTDPNHRRVLKYSGKGKLLGTQSYGYYMPYFISEAPDGNLLVSCYIGAYYLRKDFAGENGGYIGSYNKHREYWPEPLSSDRFKSVIVIFDSNGNVYHLLYKHGFVQCFDLNYNSRVNFGTDISDDNYFARVADKTLMPSNSLLLYDSLDYFHHYNTKGKLIKKVRCQEGTALSTNIAWNKSDNMLEIIATNATGTGWGAPKVNFYDDTFTHIDSLDLDLSELLNKPSQGFVTEFLILNNGKRIVAVSQNHDKHVYMYDENFEVVKSLGSFRRAGVFLDYDKERIFVAHKDENKKTNNIMRLTEYSKVGKKKKEKIITTDDVWNTWGYSSGAVNRQDIMYIKGGNPYRIYIYDYKSNRYYGSFSGSDLDSDAYELPWSSEASLIVDKKGKLYLHDENQKRIFQIKVKLKK